MPLSAIASVRQMAADIGSETGEPVALAFVQLANHNRNSPDGDHELAARFEDEPTTIVPTKMTPLIQVL